MNESERPEDTKDSEVTFSFEPLKSTEEGTELFKRHVIFDSIIIRPTGGEDRLISLGSSMKNITKSADGEEIVFVDSGLNQLNMEIERGNENREDELLESQSVVSISSRASGKTLPPTPKSLTELASYGKSSLQSGKGMSSAEFVSTKLVDVIAQLPPHVQQNLLGLLSVMVNELNSSKEDTKPSEQTNQK